MTSVHGSSGRPTGKARWKPMIPLAVDALASSGMRIPFLAAQRLGVRVREAKE
jgi:hypothetical protein